MRFLILEDDESMVKLYKHWLNKANIETDTFCDLGINAINFRAEFCNTSHLDALWKQSEIITGIVY